MNDVFFLGPHARTSASLSTTSPNEKRFIAIGRDPFIAYYTTTDAPTVADLALYSQFPLGFIHFLSNMLSLSQIFTPTPSFVILLINNRTVYRALGRALSTAGGLLRAGLRWVGGGTPHAQDTTPHDDDPTVCTMTAFTRFPSLSRSRFKQTSLMTTNTIITDKRQLRESVPLTE